MTRLRLMLALSCMFFLSCSVNVPEDAVAVWNGGWISRSDVEQRILESAPADRRPADGDFAAWYEVLARELAVERLLTTEARQSSMVEDPAVEEALEEVVEEALAEAYLERYLELPPQVTDEDVQALYDERRDHFVRPAVREVRHIYLRKAPGVGPEELHARLLALRQRVIGGESFLLLARTHSQSESRHRDGYIGRVYRGQMAPSLEGLIFGLPVATPSQPMLTSEGGHIFWVESAIEERRFELADVRRKLAEEIWDRRRGEAIDALTASYILPEGSFVPTDEDLRILHAAGDNKALMVRVGDRDLSYGEVASVLAEDPGGEVPEDIRLRRLIDDFVRRQRLVDTARNVGFDREPAVSAELERLQNSELARLWTERQMLAIVAAQEQELRSFFGNNRLRYSEPLRLRLDRLQVPIGDLDTAAKQMTRLEDAVEKLNRGELDFASLAEDLGGTVMDMQWTTFDRLRAQLPRAAQLVAPLESGQVSPPFRTTAFLVILRVSERREPEALLFESVRDRVAIDYIENRGQVVYVEMCNELLKAHDYRPLTERLVSMATSTTGDHSDSLAK